MSFRYTWVLSILFIQLTFWIYFIIKGQKQSSELISPVMDKILARDLNQSRVSLKMNITIIIKVEIAPVLPNSKVVTKALGISATIPEKIIKEIPLPIPLSVIFSPSHIQNIVPDVNIIILDIVNKNLFSTSIASLGIVPDRYAVL